MRRPVPVRHTEMTDGLARHSGHVSGPVGEMECCKTWDDNPLIEQGAWMHARLDGYPVAEGHALIIPNRHVVSFPDLITAELWELRRMVAIIQERCEADAFTIGINDGPAAGRTVAHLHIHVIPRRPGDVPDPRGGVRRLLIAEATDDPWIRARSPESDRQP